MSKEAEEAKRRDMRMRILEAKIARASVQMGNSRNFRKFKKKIYAEINKLEPKVANLLKKKINQNKLTLEEWEVNSVRRFKFGDRTIYRTYFQPINNQPCAFLEHPGVLRYFGYAPPRFTDDQIRKNLIREQEINDSLPEEEEEAKEGIEEKMEEEEIMEETKKI